MSVLKLYSNTESAHHLRPLERRKHFESIYFSLLKYLFLLLSHNFIMERYTLKLRHCCEEYHPRLTGLELPVFRQDVSIVNQTIARIYQYHNFYFIFLYSSFIIISIVSISCKTEHLNACNSAYRLPALFR